MVNQGPLTLPGRALSDHHHPLQQVTLAQGLILPLGGFNYEGAGTFGGVTPLSTAPCCETSEASSKCDHHMDTLRFLINARVNTHGFTAVESLDVHSRKVEPTMIPYVTTTIATTTSEEESENLFFIIK
jgi:hypothetical protein